MQNARWYITFEVENIVKLCGECPLWETNCMHMSKYDDEPNSSYTKDHCKLKSQVPAMSDKKDLPPTICGSCIINQTCVNNCGTITECPRFQ
jgi:hypothetical protein